MNVSYKICTKVYQKRLTKVLVRMVSTQQFAYLPGRSIHHAMLRAEEMVHKVKELQQPYVLLKVDIVKAFDSVEWGFLVAFMHRAGFGAGFIGFISAIPENANAAVILNGRITKSFDISRSVRQGCPISSLFFVMILEGISCMIQKKVQSRQLRGVAFREENNKLAHLFYSDNTTVG
jgi:hypothetical protein